jgi:hypothetical protein
VPSSIIKIGSRLTQMSWDELQMRVGQVLNQRLDLAFYHARIPLFRDGLRQFRDEMTFFFTRHDVESRTKLLREYLPTSVEEIVSEANEICEHRFRLLGYENISHGAEIDWHFDAVHGKRAPLKPWFKIHFLDFSEVGDHKIIWELNRHQHLVTLAKAWRVTKDDRYVQELLNQWYSWQRSNPYPIGINWASSLEVAFRSLAWLWVQALLIDSTSARFQTDLLNALALNGRHIEKYLSTYFSPNTHLLGEAVALFSIGTACPQIPAAELWREKGWNILLRQADRQVRPDGVYFEQSLYYHVYALDFFLHARVLASRSGMEVPKSFDTTLERMLDVVAAVTQAGPDSFGDDDGGRVFNPRRNRAEHLRDPLAIGSVLFPQQMPRWTPQVTEEVIWLFGEDAVSALNGEPMAKASLKAVCFPSGGLYVMASANGCAEQAVMDAGPQGVGNSGHGHADALSLRISMAGERWLVGAGTYCYVCDSSARNGFRGTGAHNTLRVDQEDQAIVDGPFAWRCLPDVRCERWVAGETFSVFTGSHDGYKRLADPVVHRRSVFHLHGNFWLVRDTIEGSSAHELEVFWHFASNLQVKQISSGFVASSQDAAAEMRDSPRLAVLPLEARGWNSELTSGLISPVYGKEEPAPVVRSHGLVKLPTEQATLLVPLLRVGDQCGRITKLAVPVEFQYLTAYEYAGNRKIHRMFFASKRAKTWNFGGLESDANFLYYGIEEGRIVHLIVCEASRLKVNEQLAFVQNERCERLECILRDNRLQTFSTSELPSQTWLRETTVS